MASRSTIQNLALHVLPVALFISLAQAQEGSNDQEAIDQLQRQVANDIPDEEIVAVIDHGRLAEKAGVPMRPSIVTIWSDPAINTPLVQIEPRMGLDLPLKVLTYSEVGGKGPAVAFASDEFLMKRHGIKERSLLGPYQKELEQALAKIPGERQTPTSMTGVDVNFGVVEFESDYAFDETLERLKKVILSQSDTVWFGEVDYQADAAKGGVEIPALTLLLFGGPGPGGQAMAAFPKLGLDAFCQKLLVIEDTDGKVRIIFNDIVDFAKLHYGKSSRPQQVINGRLTATFKKAIEK